MLRRREKAAERRIRVEPKLGSSNGDGEAWVEGRGSANSMGGSRGVERPLLKGRGRVPWLAGQERKGGGATGSCRTLRESEPVLGVGRRKGPIGGARVAERERGGEGDAQSWAGRKG